MLAVIVDNRGGPGEREEALERGRRHLRRAGVEDSQIVRMDVPPTRGGGATVGGGPEPQGVFRLELNGLVPLLQSSSLFGGKQGVLLVDTHLLQAAEARALEALLSQHDPAAVAVAFIAQGSLPAPLKKAVKEVGKLEQVRPLWESQIHGWISHQIREKGLRMGYQARQALVQRFGTDRSALKRALEQLQGEHRPISAEMIVERFRNRPDQPVFRLLDEIIAGDTPAVLRRLGDYLANARSSDGRPHILLGALESDLRLRLLAAEARNREQFRQWEEDNTFSRMLESAAGPLDEKAESRVRSGAKSRIRSSSRRLDRIWKQRKPLSSVNQAHQLRAARRALALLVAADRTLKLYPASLHLAVLERTVAELCRIYPTFARA